VKIRKHDIKMLQRAMAPLPSFATTAEVRALIDRMIADRKRRKARKGGIIRIWWDEAPEPPYFHLGAEADNFCLTDAPGVRPGYTEPQAKQIARRVFDQQGRSRAYMTRDEMREEYRKAGGFVAESLVDGAGWQWGYASITLGREYGWYWRASRYDGIWGWFRIARRNCKNPATA
jgi:hypothetical protein